MVNVKMAARAAIMVIALVFVVAVAGASADGVRGDRDNDTIHFSTFQTSLNSDIHSHWDFSWNGGFERFNGLRDGYWLKVNDDDNWDNDNSWSAPDPTPSPEPGTIFLLAAGVAGLMLMGRRNAFQQ